MNRLVKLLSFALILSGSAHSASAAGMSKWAGVFERLGFSEGHLPDSLSKFFDGFSTAERKTPSLATTDRVHQTGDIRSETFVRTENEAASGSIEMLAVRRNDIRQTAIPIQPLPPVLPGVSSKVVSGKLDTTSQYMYYGRTEAVLTRKVEGPQGKEFQVDDFYHVRSDEFGTWGVRNRVDIVYSRDFKVHSVSWDPNKMDITVNAPEGAKVAGQPLKEYSTFQTQFELPQSEHGNIVSHQIDIFNNELTVRTSSGNEYVYTIALTMKDANPPGWVSKPPQYLIEHKLKDGYPLHLPASEMARYRAVANDFGRQQAAGGGTARGMKVDLPEDGGAAHH